MTNLVQLEEDLNWLESGLEDSPNRDLQGYDFKDLRYVIEAARAHMEAMKQEPRETLLHDHQRHVDGWVMENIPNSKEHIYTTPPPAERAALYLPDYLEIIGADAEEKEFQRGINETIDEVKRMNPHLKVEKL